MQVLTNLNFSALKWTRLSLYVEYSALCWVLSFRQSIFRPHRSKTMDYIFSFWSDHVLLRSLKYFFKWTNLRSLHTSVQNKSKATGESWVDRSSACSALKRSRPISLLSPSCVKKTRQNEMKMNPMFRVFLTFIGPRNQNKNSMV